MKNFKNVPTIKRNNLRLYIQLSLFTIFATASLFLWQTSAQMQDQDTINADQTTKGVFTDAPTVTPFMDIASAGPLTNVYIGNELSCQVRHVLDTALEFYPSTVIPGDCGTFIAMGGILYAPDFAAHGGTATGNLGVRTVFTPLSQTAVTGSGTSGDPFKVVTVVGVAATGLMIEQTDTYVVGQDYYTTDVKITNGGISAAAGVVYRAADAFLGGSDNGYGFTETFDTRKAIGCSKTANNTPADRIEEWIPLTGGNNYFQSFYSTVWSAIGAKTPFPDTCGCATLQDNGAGVSWNFAIPAGGISTYSHVTTFSPLGLEGLVTSKTADSPTSQTGTQNGYTITIQNPNTIAVTLNSITDTLPAGFSYVTGSTTGATTNDPAVALQVLTWSGPIVVPASGSISLHFAVTVASTPGDYFNEAGGNAAGGYNVIGTGPTAPITVTAPTATSTATFTPTATATETFTPTATSTETFTPTPTATETFTPTPTATETFTPTATATETFTPTATATETFTPTPTATETFTPTATSTATATNTATNTPTNTATSTPTNTPTPAPTALQTRFVIGDLNASVGQNVTFWGAQWANKNQLSGGPAPDKFKGYADSVTPAIPACGGTWTATPGGSTKPPSTLPQYIVVLVASNAVALRSNISGNIVRMVVVRVDPGYGTAPGHEGTGTVTSIVCAPAAHRGLMEGVNDTVSWLVPMIENEPYLLNGLWRKRIDQK